MPLWSIKKRKEVGREGLIEMGGGVNTCSERHRERDGREIAFH